LKEVNITEDQEQSHHTIGEDTEEKGGEEEEEEGEHEDCDQGPDEQEEWNWSWNPTISTPMDTSEWLSTGTMWLWTSATATTTMAIDMNMKTTTSTTNVKGNQPATVKARTRVEPRAKPAVTPKVSTASSSGFLNLEHRQVTAEEGEQAAKRLAKAAEEKEGSAEKKQRCAEQQDVQRGKSERLATNALNLEPPAAQTSQSIPRGELLVHEQDSKPVQLKESAAAEAEKNKVEPWTPTRFEEEVKPWVAPWCGRCQSHGHETKFCETKGLNPSLDFMNRTRPQDKEHGWDTDQMTCWRCRKPRKFGQHLSSRCRQLLPTQQDPAYSHEGTITCERCGGQSHLSSHCLSPKKP